MAADTLSTVAEGLLVWQALRILVLPESVAPISAATVVLQLAAAADIIVDLALASAAPAGEFCFPAAVFPLPSATASTGCGVTTSVSVACNSAVYCAFR